MKTFGIDISSHYLGLALRSPLIPAASPLSDNLRGLYEMENAGAGAVVLHSFFDETSEGLPCNPDCYTDHIATAKSNLSIPVIASLNATSIESWVNCARLIERAGADALELNIYNLTLSPEIPSETVEDGYVRIVEAVARTVKIPISVKISPFFTNLSRMTWQLEKAGAAGIVLFNRFYQSDVHLEGSEPDDSLTFSSQSENRLASHWISLLYRQLDLDLAANTGIKTGEDALKAILCGASVVQLCGVLMQHGIAWLHVIENELRDCMERCHLYNLTETRGKFSHRSGMGIGEIEREEYRKALQGYSQIEVPSWHDEATLHG